MSLGQKVIDLIISEELVTTDEDPNVLVWAKSAPQQIDALINDHIGEVDEVELMRKIRQQVVKQLHLQLVHNPNAAIIDKAMKFLQSDTSSAESIPEALQRAQEAQRAGGAIPDLDLDDDDEATESP
jgi:hypothetical protein